MKPTNFWKPSISNEANQVLRVPNLQESNPTSQTSHSPPRKNRSSWKTNLPITQQTSLVGWRMAEKQSKQTPWVLLTRNQQKMQKMTKETRVWFSVLALAQFSLQNGHSKPARLSWRQDLAKSPCPAQTDAVMGVFHCVGGMGKLSLIKL